MPATTAPAVDWSAQEVQPPTGKIEDWGASAPAADWGASGMPAGDAAEWGAGNATAGWD